MPTVTSTADYRREILDEIFRDVEHLDAEAMPEHFHEGQGWAWSDYTSLDIVICAGVQGGKTEVVAHWLLREIQRTAKYSEYLQGSKRAVYLYVGPTLELLKAQALPAFKSLFEDELKLGRLIEGNKPRFVFSPSGARRLCGKAYRIVVVFGYANDSSNIESVTALGGAWDEAGQKENKLASFRAFNSRLKVARSLGKELGVSLGRRIYSTTPYEWGWFKTHVVDPAIAGEDGFKFYNWPSWFNPLVDEDECRKELDRMPLAEWRMRYLGVFERPGGLIYDCFDDVVRPGSNVWPGDVRLPKEWPRCIGIDFGPNNTAAVIFAQMLKRTGYDLDGKPIWGEATGIYIAEREYHTGKHDTPEGHLHQIVGTLDGPFCAGGSRNEADSRMLYGMHGFPVAEPLIKEVEAGIRNVYGGVKCGQLIVLATCPGLIKEFGTYSRELDEEGDRTKDIAEKSKYHLLDAVRYIWSYIPPFEIPLTEAERAMEKPAMAYSFSGQVTR